MNATSAISSCTVTSIAITATNARPALVNVRVDLVRRLPMMVMAGPVLTREDDAAQLDRVRTAIREAGFDVPSCRVVVSVDAAPMEFRRGDTSALDRAIVTAILVASEQLPPQSCAGLIAGQYCEFTNRYTVPGWAAAYVQTCALPQ